MLKKIVIFLLFIGLLVGGFLLLVVALRTPEKPDKRLTSISLKLPPSPKTLEGAKSFMKDKRALKFKAFTKVLLQRLRKQTGFWPTLSALKKLKSFPGEKGWKDLQTRWEKESVGFVSLIEQKTCLPYSLDIKNNEYKYMKVIKYTKLWKLLLWSKLGVGLGKAEEKSGAFAADPVAKQFLSFVNAFDHIEDKCPESLIIVMLMTATYEMLFQLTPYLIKHPAVSPASKEKVLAWLKRWETRKPIAVEHAFRLEAKMFEKVLREDISKNVAKEIGIPAARAWPWWDLEDTIRMSHESKKEMIYHTRLSPAKKEFWTYMKELDKKYRTTPAKWRLIFTYNAIGHILHSIAAPAFVRYSVRWRQNRCLALFWHARHAAYLKKQGLTLKDKSLLVAANNPFTNKPFTLDRVSVCSVPRPSGKSTYMKGRKVPAILNDFPIPTGKKLPTPPQK
ncbi:MAG: hypothetical protein CL920_36380 [Deltaproteobacteria bacterium]|nr:hypothetical protein [Deltaproteobacteria bacterium]MBU54207.1 hypothetical protein [Deltaproteobacteria bacterium]|tara:strand:+ start:5942 stop:7288 length:1347 start_codon:yes stop_codon:yes gene_type:complete